MQQRQQRSKSGKQGRKLERFLRKASLPMTSSMVKRASINPSSLSPKLKIQMAPGLMNVCIFSLFIELFFIVEIKRANEIAPPALYTPNYDLVSPTRFH
jgi:hypothetical protein